MRFEQIKNMIQSLGSSYASMFSMDLLSILTWVGIGLSQIILGILVFNIDGDTGSDASVEHPKPEAKETFEGTRAIRNNNAKIIGILALVLLIVNYSITYLIGQQQFKTFISELYRYGLQFSYGWQTLSNAYNVTINETYLVSFICVAIALICFYYSRTLPLKNPKF